MLNLFSIHHFNRLDSTNAWCWRNPNYPRPLVVCCHQQTDGRGRGNNRWYTKKGDVIFSISDHLKTPIRASISVLLAAKITLELGRHFHQLRFKWPNDLYLIDDTSQSLGSQTKPASHKVAGILIENKQQGACQELVIGLGINVNAQHDCHLPLMNIFADLDAVLHWFYQRTHETLQTLNHSDCLNTLNLIDLNPLHLLHQQPIYFDSPENLPKIFVNTSQKAQQYRARVQGIDSQGRLIVRHMSQCYRLTHGYNLSC